MRKQLLFMLLSFMPLLAWGFEANASLRKTDNSVIQVTLVFADFGNGECYVTGAADPDALEGTLIIPSTVIDGNVVKTVRSIGMEAFKYNSKLTGLVLPGTLTSIGYDSFYNCISDWSSAFEDCTNLESVVFEDGTDEELVIGSRNFKGCSKLTSVTLPSTLKEIWDYAFNSCPLEGNLVIPEGCTSIGREAFIGAQITSLTLPSTISYVGYDCFNGVPITSLTLTNGISGLLDRAFSECNGLTAISIPGSVETLPMSLFSNCTNLETVTLDEGIKYIGSNVFAGCAKLNHVTFPSTVKTIGDFSFTGCTSLSDITLNEGLTSLGSRAFENTPNLISLGMPSTVSFIGDLAFTGSGLASVVIPAAMTEISNGAFACSSLKQVTIPSTVKKIKGGSSDWGAFSYCALTSVVIPSSVEVIEKNAFCGCYSLTSVTLNEGLKSIGPYAFSETAVSSYTIPASVTTIDEFAFAWCGNLQSLTITDSGNKATLTIGNRAFENNSIFRLIIPGSVKSIGFDSFKQESSSLQELYIEEGVQSIGDNAFAGGSRESYSVTLPTTLTDIGYNAFTINGYPWLPVAEYNGVIYVPESVYWKYTTGSDTFYLNEHIHWYVENGFLKQLVPPQVGDVFTIEEFTYEVTSISPLEVKVKSVSTDKTHIDVLTEIAHLGNLYNITDIDKAAFNDNCPYLHTVGTDIPILVGKITLSGESTLEVIGQTTTLTAAVTPLFAQNQTLAWSSSDTSIATVDQNGKVTATGQGIVRITATATDGSGTYGTKDITVSGVSSFAFSKASDNDCTFSSLFDIDFTNVSGIKVYIASGYNYTTEVLTLTRVYEVPAGTGLYMKGAAGEYNLPYSPTQAVYANLLVGTTVATTIYPTEDGYTNYVLNNGSFHPFSNPGTLGAGKAYLHLPTMVTANSIRLYFDDDEGTTSIENGQLMMDNGADAWYSLDGTRLSSAPTMKGLYIHNGKKVLIP